MRRQALQRERNELTNLSYQVQRDLDRANSDIEQTEFFLRNIRAKLYPEIEKELADL
jgi:outer membrane protein TolC